MCYIAKIPVCISLPIKLRIEPFIIFDKRAKLANVGSRETVASSIVKELSVILS